MARSTALLTTVVMVATALAGCADDTPEAETAPILEKPLEESANDDSQVELNPLAHADHGSHANHAMLSLDCDLGAMIGYPSLETARGLLPEGVEPAKSEGFAVSRVAAAGEDSAFVVMYAARCTEETTLNELSWYGVAISLDVDWPSHGEDSTPPDREPAHWYFADVGFSEGPVAEHVRAFGFPIRDVDLDVVVVDGNGLQMQTEITDADGALAAYGTDATLTSYNQSFSHVQWYMVDDQWYRLDANDFPIDSSGGVGQTVDCSVRAGMWQEIFAEDYDCEIASADAVAWKNMEFKWHFELAPDPRLG